MPEQNGANPGDMERRKSDELKDSFELRLTNEEGMLLLTSARLLDKLVAGVTIHAEERDQLIKDVIAKIDSMLPPDVAKVAFELADAIVESVICDGEMEEDYGLFADDDFVTIDGIEPRDHPSLLPSGEVGMGSLTEKLFDYPMYNIDSTLPVLEKALVNHQCVKAYYYSILREAVDPVTLDPLVIMREQNLWRMVAYCHERRDILVFRVDRIKEIVQTKTPFEAPADVSQLSYSRLPVYS